MQTRIKNLMVAAFFCAALSIFTVSATAQLRSLTIVTEPNASVWVDDVNYGKTDESGKLVLRTFPAGTHKIRVRADGFKEITQNLLPAQKGEFKIALTKTTDEAELAFQQAEAMSAVDREKAVALYQKAVKLRPKYAEAFVGLARVYQALSEYDAALRAIQNARRARLAYAEASAVEGRIYKESGNETKSVAAFKRAITEGKGVQPEAHAGLGLLYRERAENFGINSEFESEKENYLLAAGELRKAVEQLAGSPDAATIYQLLGDSFERAKMFADAIKVYEEYIKNFPDADDVTTFRSFITQLQKRIKEEQ
ncbi:MAG TPA: tetratricopeptide repeat protein [Pyrinomonadaceae bacterium]|jgi:tetratricopeptide (TPR) repeat protein